MDPSSSPVAVAASQALALVRREIPELLRPWTHALDVATRLPPWYSEWDDARGDGIVWVEMVTENVGAEPRAFEALELLTLLGQIDAGVWEDAVMAAWPRTARKWIDAAMGKAWRFGCQLTFSNRDDDSVAIAPWCERIVVDGMEIASSHEYATLRKLLEAAYHALPFAPKTSNEVVPREELDIPVRITLYEEEHADSLLQLLQVVALQHARLHPLTAFLEQETHPPLFRIVEVADGGFCELLTAKTFLYITRIIGYGVDMKDLYLRNVGLIERSASFFTPGLQLLLAAAGVVSPVGSVRNVVVPSALTRQATAAIYSALSASQSVRSVMINERPITNDEHEPAMAPEDIEDVWRWIAFSLFSHQATHHIGDMRIHVGDLSLPIVSAMRDVVYHPDPASVLCDPSLSEDVAGLAEVVTACRFHMTSRLQSTEEAAIFTLASQSVRILQSSHNVDDGVSVMLPGWGPARVQQDDCRSRSIARMQSPVIKPISKVCLIQINDQNMQAAVALLRLVGHAITALKIVLAEISGPLDDWLRDVFQACPQLDNFTLHSRSQLDSLDTLAKAYETELIHLKRIYLSGIGLDDAECAHEFFLKLADESHPMAKQLRVFRFEPSDSLAPMPHLEASLITMLTSNRLLEDLHVIVGHENHVPEQDLIRITNLAAYDKGPIAARLLPLTLKSKLALLSVGGSKNGQQHDVDGLRGEERLADLARRLDRGLLSLIFEYAAPCRRRKVAVFVFNREPRDE